MVTRAVLLLVIALAAVPGARRRRRSLRTEDVARHTSPPCRSCAFVEPHFRFRR